MPIYTNRTFEGFNPVGSSAIVKAASPEEAAEFLNEELKDKGLPGDTEAKDMILFPAKGEGVRILHDGDY